MCRCQDRQQDTGGREEGPASLLLGPWDGGAEGQRESQRQLAVCKQIIQQINFSDAQLVFLSNPAALPVCLFHFAAGLGKRGSASVPGHAREQSSGGWGSQSGSTEWKREQEARRAGGAFTAGRRRGKEPTACVCVCPLVCASASVLCVHLCRCICVSVCGYVLCVCVCVCLSRWVRWAGSKCGG